MIRNPSLESAGFLQPTGSSGGPPSFLQPAGIAGPSTATGLVPPQGTAIGLVPQTATTTGSNPQTFPTTGFMTTIGFIPASSTLTGPPMFGFVQPTPPQPTGFSMQNHITTASQPGFHTQVSSTDSNTTTIPNRSIVPTISIFDIRRNCPISYAIFKDPRSAERFKRNLQGLDSTALANLQQMKPEWGYVKDIEAEFDSAIIQATDLEQECEAKVQAAKEQLRKRREEKAAIEEAKSKFEKNARFVYAAMDVEDNIRNYRDSTTSRAHAASRTSINSINTKLDFSKVVNSKAVVVKFEIPSAQTMLSKPQKYSRGVLVKMIMDIQASGYEKSKAFQKYTEKYRRINGGKLYEKLPSESTLRNKRFNQLVEILQIVLGPAI